MPDTFDFEEEYESEVNTLDDAPQAEAHDSQAAVRRHLYQSHRAMLSADGSPIIAGESAQQRLERESRQAQQRAARSAAAAARRVQEAQPEEEPEYSEDEAMDEAMESLQEERRSVEATLSEAEHRFDKAQYYRLVLSQPLISNPSPAGQEVIEELRKFAQERFEIFLGMRQETPVSTTPPEFQGWEPEDFQTLHALVRRIRQKPELTQASPAPKPEPTLTPVTTKPVASPVAKAPHLTPVSVSTPRQPAPKPTALKKAAPAPAAKPKAKVPPKGPQKRIIRPLVNKNTGEVVKDPVTGKTMMQDVTPQVQPPPNSPHQPVPMPTDRVQIEMLHEAKANESIATQNALQRASSGGMKVKTAMTMAAASLARQNGTDGEVVFEGQYIPSND